MHLSDSSVSMAFQSHVHDCIDGFDSSSSSLQPRCTISSSPSNMRSIESAFIPQNKIRTLVDPEWLTVPNSTEIQSYNDGTTNVDSIISMSTFPGLTTSPRSLCSCNTFPAPQADDLSKYGVLMKDRSWRCTYPGCRSKVTFQRGCDLRKHYKRHSKTLFCRYSECPKSLSDGFSSEKDRIRHEAKHNPTIKCEWDGCFRLFSRKDNMKDHVRRVHQRHAYSQS